MPQPPEPNPPVPVQSEPERWLTLGEAAELLRLPDMELGRAVREGRLTTRVGWRRGRMTRLVRAGDLIALDPAVAQRALPAEVEALVGPLAAPPPVEAGTPAPERATPAHDVGGPYLQDELDLLREQVRATRADNERLLGELVESGREVRDLFGRLESETAQRSTELGRREEERERIEQALAALRTTRRIAAAALVLALAMIAWALTSTGGAKDEVRAAEESTTRLAQAAATEDGDPEVPEPTQPAVPPAELEADPDPVADPVPSPAQEPVDPDPAPDPERLDPNPAPPGDPPCQFHALTRPGMELRALLGPCSGRWSATHEAVAASVRRGREAYCRHHHFFATTLDGSVTRAREVAAFSEREGLIPPLVELRVNRAGAAFLRRRVDDWIESGFEAGLAGAEDGHVLTALERPDAWSLRSWVRYLDVGGVEQRRRFEMELELDDGPGGDRLLEFTWAD